MIKLFYSTKISLNVNADFEVCFLNCHDNFPHRPAAFQLSVGREEEQQPSLFRRRRHRPSSVALALLRPGLVLEKFGTLPLAELLLIVDDCFLWDGIRRALPREREGNGMQE